MERPEPQVIDYYKRINQPKKCKRLNTWKSQGMFSDNWDETYMKFMNKSNCENCGVKFTYGKACKTTKVLDHDHTIPFGKHNIRNILCMSCNSKRQ